MSAPDITPKVLRQFDALRDGSHLTLLLGAGASASAGIPDWDTLAVQVAVASGVVPSREAGELLVSKQDPMLVLQAARQKARGRWNELLNAALYGAGPHLPSALHLAAAGRYVAEPDNTTLATLNFDRLLEQALAEATGGTAYSSVSETVGPDGATVHHLHGIVDGPVVDDAVVTFTDYAELLASPDAWQRDWISDSLHRGPILIAGTSFRDPDLRQWVHSIVHDTPPPPHSGIVTIVREGLKLTREQFATIDDALLAEWQSIGLSALTLQDFADIALVIRELAHAGDENYRAPSTRARELWVAHNKALPELQPEYATQLDIDALRMGEAVGFAAHRATLWLAAGRGKLARWATSSAEYRDVRTMKRVPTGHDSLWIAGEAMGSETPKVKDITRDPSTTPRWKSALAIPIIVSDGRLPGFTSAVLTFGIDAAAIPVWENQKAWEPLARELSQSWGTRLSAIAFHN